MATDLQTPAQSAEHAAGLGGELQARLALLRRMGWREQLKEIGRASCRERG